MKFDGFWLVPLGMVECLKGARLGSARLGSWVGLLVWFGLGLRPHAGNRALSRSFVLGCRSPSPQRICCPSLAKANSPCWHNAGRQSWLAIKREKKNGKRENAKTEIAFRTISVSLFRFSPTSHTKWALLFQLPKYPSCAWSANHQPNIFYACLM